MSGVKICRHSDQVECGMTGISNLHNKQWNSNYQPSANNFPRCDISTWDCSIIHRHSVLGRKKKNKRKESRQRMYKIYVRTNLSKVIIYSSSGLCHMQRENKTMVTLYNASPWNVRGTSESLVWNCSHTVYKYTFQIRRRCSRAEA